MKLNLGILLMVVPIFVVTLGILFIQSRKHIKDEAMERATSELNTTMQRVLRYIGTVETATNISAWMVEEKLDSATLKNYSRRILELNTNVSSCSITTEPGITSGDSRYFSVFSVRKKRNGQGFGDSIVTVREKEYEHFDKTWYKTLATQQQAYWFDGVDSIGQDTLQDSKMTVSYCRPLYDKNRRFAGVISAGLSLHELSEIIIANKPSPRSYYLLLGQDGHYLVHPDSSRLFKESIFSIADVRSHPDITALGHEMTTGKQGIMEVVIDNNPCLVVYQPVKGTRWSLALVCPRGDILERYYRLAYIVPPIIFIGLLLILLLCYRIVTHAVAPLNRLLDQAQKIATGNYDDFIPRSQRKDVVGRLQNSFAAMQQSINCHTAIIRHVNTETERRNEELQKARLMVEESNRQKTIFIQNMTHQIRTPLNIIMGFAQVLRDSGQTLPEVEIKDISQMMDHNAKLLNRMVLMLFDSSETGILEEMNSHRYEEVSCNEIARESINHTKQHFPGLSIRFETTLPDSFIIHTSHVYLMRSLRELLYNSAKYSDGKSIRVLLSKTDTTVRFIIEDKGTGISSDNIQLMFLPFTKVDDLSEGLGLGLPLAKRHVCNLGGDLTLDFDYHDGCRFMIELPIK